MALWLFDVVVLCDFVVFDAIVVFVVVPVVEGGTGDDGGGDGVVVDIVGNDSDGGR